MEINKILSSDFLDIIFEGRNKDYGAYELRKTYNQRLSKALITTAGVVLLVTTGYMFANTFAAEPLHRPEIADSHIVELKDEPKKEIVIPPKPKPELPKVQTKQYTIPIIVNKEVKVDEQPPEMKDLEDSKIGLINTQGVKDDNITAPPNTDNNKGIVVAPKTDLTDYEKTFTKVEIESSYPGGAGAWMRYLNKTFRYPGDAQEINLQGTVVVQFIVDKEGNVSDVEAISGPTNGGLRDEAIRVIKKSGKWEPAIQNGRQVKSYKKQPITFKLETE